jgi:hypothetical protein
VRAAAQAAKTWGEPVGVVQVVVVAHLDARVAATELLEGEGTENAAVELQATWDVQIPPHLQGIIQLHTTASVNGHSTALRSPCMCYRS